MKLHSASYRRVLFGLISLFFFLLVVSFFSIFEDAFISLRYAVQFASGRGLVFNPGEWVWGYSNLAWTVLVGVGVWLGLNAVFCAKFLGVMAAMMVMLLLFNYHSPWFSTHAVKKGPLFLLHLSAPLLFITSTHVLIHAQNGLETMLFALFVLWGVLGLLASMNGERPLVGYALPFLLASLTRPEGPLLMVVALCIDGLNCLARRRGLFRVVLAGLVFALGYSLYLAIMYFVYGQIVPNAFYVKIPSATIGHGIDYIADFLSDIRWILLLWPIPFAFIDRSGRSDSITAVCFCLGYSVFIVYAGGDFQAYFNRFMVPILPLLFLLTANGLLGMHRLLIRLYQPLAGSISVLALIFILLVNTVLVRSPIIRFFDPLAPETSLVLDATTIAVRSPSVFITQMRNWFSSENLDIHPMGFVGQTLAKWLPVDVRMATEQMGQIGYYLGSRHIMDIGGLMDNYLARRGMSAEYLLSQRIDHMILYYKPEDPLAVPQTLIPSILADPRVQKQYYLNHVFEHTSIIETRNLRSKVYMLLFSRRGSGCEPSDPIIVTDVGKESLANFVAQAKKRGFYTDGETSINGPRRGVRVLSERIPCLASNSLSHSFRPTMHNKLRR